MSQLLTRARRSHGLRLAPLLTCALLVSACGELTQANPTLNRYGAINIAAQGGTNASVPANATVIFFEAFTAAVPNSALQRTDECRFAAFDTTVTLTRGANKAGDNVNLAFGTQSVVLPYQASLLRYANPFDSPFTYASGDAAVVNIPGAAGVYPASSISVLLAEPIVPGAIALPAAGAPLVVTWNATTDATTAVILSLRYANPASGTFGNEQIFCALADDGRHELPGNALGPFLAAPGGTRSLRLTRWRTREALLDPSTVLHIATSVDSTIRIP